MEIVRRMIWPTPIRLIIDSTSFEDPVGQLSSQSFTIEASNWITTRTIRTRNGCAILPQTEDYGFLVQAGTAGTSELTVTMGPQQPS